MEAPYNVVDLFFDATTRNPEREAVITEETVITYGELAEKVIKTAAYFQQKGLRKGDRVLVFVPMSIDLYRIVLALFRIGATAGRMGKQRAVANVLQDCQLSSLDRRVEGQVTRYCNARITPYADSAFTHSTYSV
jgi:olefin beta-lactone synthetase